MSKILVIATSRKTRGGVTSVVKAHEQGKQWKYYGCEWIETHRDGNIFVKIGWLIKGWLKFICKLPGCNLVHIHTSEPPSALRKSVFFMPLIKLTRKKVIVHFHSFSPDTTTRSRWAFLYRYLFEKSDRVIVLSEYWKKEVEKDVPNAKVVVVYNPCLANVSCIEKTIAERSQISYANNDPEVKKKSILFAGTINARKGYSDMLKAFAKIANRHHDWQIVFAGNGEIEHGKALSKELGISNQTMWLGWVNGTEKDHAFREALVFCLPSYAEGFPMSVLDAWSYALPVITTPVGGIPDIAKDGVNILLINPGDVDSLAKCMERMMDDIELRNRISNASLELARTTFNIETINEKIGELYEKVLNEYS